MNTDGNLDAIERELEAQENYDASQPNDVMYCHECDEGFLGSEDICPNCENDLEETP